MPSVLAPRKYFCAASATHGHQLYICLQQEQEPLDAFRLHPESCLSEDSLSESETRNKRYSKAMTLKLPRSEVDSDRESAQELLLFQHDLEEDRGSRSQRVWFAAENEKQHLSWHSKSNSWNVTSPSLSLDF